MSDWSAIKQMGLLQLPDLLKEWFPNGRVKGGEFQVGSLEGEKGTSLSINLRKGCGADFATGQKFGDVIDLYAAKFHVEPKEAARVLADRFGIQLSTPRRATNIHALEKRLEPPQPSPPATWQEVWERHKIERPPAHVPLDAEQFTDHRRGKPDHVYVYRDEDGAPLYVVTRWDADPDEALHKTFSPWIWGGDTWVRKGPPSPRPLFGLPALYRHSTKVLVVEGEKCAIEAQRLFPNNPVVAWPNGASAVKSADWSALKGREVIIWGDNDPPGREAVLTLGALLAPIVKGLWWVDASNMHEGFDVADLADKPPSMAREFVKDRRREWKTVSEESWQDKLPPPPPPPDEDAPKTRVIVDDIGLERKTSGRPYASSDNAIRVLSAKIPDGQLHYDLFLNQIRIWEKGKFVKLSDHHIITLMVMMQREFLIQEIKKNQVADAISLYARSRVRNSVQEWLAGLSWDNEPRLERLFAEGFGAEDSEYTRSVSKNFMLGMVARAIRPGCQVDTLPILEGHQGIGKSRGLEALGGEWYADIDAPIGSKEFSEQIQGKWLVELSELSAMRPSEIERVKSGITRVVDVYREPFALLATDHPRQCVFAGTTNQSNYLLDDSGNRRFWPVRCGVINREWIRTHREQLFAEAAAAIQDGATWWQMPKEITEREQEARMLVDNILDKVSEFVVQRTGTVRISEMLDSWDVPLAQRTPALSKRIAIALKSLHYVAYKSNGLQTWKPTATDRPTVISIRKV
jgi:hypothetical protein